MSSKFPLDLKHFKKTSADKHSTTLIHKNGHEVKIVHSALKPDLKAALVSMPMAEPPKKEIDSKDWGGSQQLAHGGEASDKPLRDRHVRGVHRPLSESAVPGTSMAGVYAKRSSDPTMKQEAIKHHGKVMEESKAMPKPNLYAQGGGVMSNRFNPKLVESNKPLPHYQSYAYGTPTGGAQNDDDDAPPPVDQEALANFNATHDDDGYYGTPKSAPTPVSQENDSDDNSFAPSAPMDVNSKEYADKKAETDAALKHQMANHKYELGANDPDQNTAEIAANDQGIPENHQQQSNVNAPPSPSQAQPDGEDNQKYLDLYNKLKLQYRSGNKLTDTPPMSDKDAEYMATETVYNQKIADQKDAADKKVALQKGAEETDARQKMMDQKAAYFGAKPLPADTAPMANAAANTAPNSGMPSQQQPTDSQTNAGPVNSGQATPQSDNPYLSSLTNATGVAAQGIKKEYEAGQILTNAEISRQKNLQEASKLAQANLQTAAQKFNDSIADTDKETSSIAHELRNGHIDEGQFWANKTGPQKIMGTLGLLLSGMGSATLGRESSASAYLDRQIQNNIEDQRKMMDVKGNVLNSLLHKYNDKSVALAAYQVAVNKVVEANAAEQAAKMGTPIAQANFLKLQGDLANKNAGLMTTLTRAQMNNERPTSNGPGQSQVPTRESTDQNINRIRQNLNDAIPNEPDPEKRKDMEIRLKYWNDHYVNGVGEFGEPVQGEARQQLQANAAYLKAAKAYEKFAQQHSSALDWANPAVRSQATILAKEMGNSFNMATGGGSSHAQQEDLHSLIPPPRGPFNQYDAIPTIRELTKFINIRDNELKTQHAYKDANKIPETPLGKK